MSSTYEPIATTTLGSAVASYTFSSIPSGYTDLRLVFNGQTSADADWTIQFNSDTGSLYSCTYIQGYSVAQSTRRSNDNQMYMGYLFASNQSTVTCDVMNYANATTYKTSISRVANGGGLVQSYVGLWRNTPAAINTIKVLCNGGNFNTGSTFTLYGIQAA